MNQEKTLEVKINRLPEDLKREVSDFIDFIFAEISKEKQNQK